MENKPFRFKSKRCKLEFIGIEFEQQEYESLLFEQLSNKEQNITTKHRKDSGNTYILIDFDKTFETRKSTFFNYNGIKPKITTYRLNKDWVNIIKWFDIETQNPKTCICGKTDNLKKCNKCHSKDYCSMECLKEDWNKHKEECKLLSSVVSNTLQPSTTTTTLQPFTTTTTLQPFTAIQNRFKTATSNTQPTQLETMFFVTDINNKAHYLGKIVGYDEEIAIKIIKHLLSINQHIELGSELKIKIYSTTYKGKSVCTCWISKDRFPPLESKYVETKDQVDYFTLYTGAHLVPMLINLTLLCNCLPRRKIADGKMLNIIIKTTKLTLPSSASMSLEKIETEEVPVDCYLINFNNSDKHSFFSISKEKYNSGKELLPEDFAPI